MLNHPTLEKLTELRLSGMKEALCEQQSMPDIEELDFEERLGLLVDTWNGWQVSVEYAFTNAASVDSVSMASA